MKRARLPWIWIIALALGILLVLLAFWMDGPVHAWQQRHNWKNITLLRRYVTRATDWPSHVVVGLALGALAWRRGNQKWTRIFIAMVAAAALAGTSAYALKVTTGRVRPSVKVEKGWGKQSMSLRQNYQSFPSGHTAVSTGFFAVLFMASRRVGLLCLPIPMFVAFTRVFLGAHYLSDVFAAIVLGIWSAMLIAHFMLDAKARSPAPNLT